MGEVDQKKQTKHRADSRIHTKDSWKDGKGRLRGSQTLGGGEEMYFREGTVHILRSDRSSLDFILFFHFSSSSESLRGID